MIEDRRRASGFLLFLSLIWLSLASAVSAQIVPTTPSTTIGTGYLVSPTQAAAYYASLGSAATNSTNQLWQSGRPPEIVELSRALKGDPDLIYEFVRNNVTTEWSFGLQKGALGALIDRSGTDFDQAMLMVELIRQAGGTANYQFGAINASMTPWTNINYDAQICQLLANAGIPAVIAGTTNATCGYAAQTTGTVTMMHVWVQVIINGVSYLYDPSYKTYTFNLPATLQGFTGFSSNKWLPLASSGMTSGTVSGVPYVSSLNATSLNSSLTSTGTALQTYIETSLPTNVVSDLVGGAHIVTAINQPRVTSLSYVTGTPTTWTGGIPDAYRTTLGVAVSRTTTGGGTLSLFNQTVFVDEIYGRKLMLFSRNAGGGGTGVDTLGLVDEFGNIKTVATAGQPSSDGPAFNDATITLTANHPYASSATNSAVADGTYMDATVTKHAVMWMPLLILNSWGDVDKRIVDKWGAPDDSVAPFQQSNGCETCNVYLPSTGDMRRAQLGAAWMAQASYAARMHAALANDIYTQHHALGVVAGDTEILTVDNNPSNPGTDLSYSVQDSFDRLDIDTAFSLTVKTYLSGGPALRRPVVLAIADTLDALEGSVSSQISDLPDTSSTATRLAWGNAPPVAEDPIGGGVSRKVYHYANATAAAQATNLVRFEGAVQASGVEPHGATSPTIDSIESTQWTSALNAAVVAYAGLGYDIVASEESFLGPGQRAGAFEQQGTAQNYFHTLTKQRGGAMIATLYSGLDPVQIAHVTVGLRDRAKGGGGGAQAGHQAQYDPSKAGDVLKAKFVDHSSALGVDLLNGSVTYTSPASLSVGQGEFPEKLDAQLIWRGGQLATSTYGPAQHTSPQAPWTSNWNNGLNISGSAIEAMGDTDIRTSAGTVTAFEALQDIYAQAPSPQRDAAAALVSAWWVNTQLAGNIATVSVGAGTQQFVHRVNGDWLSPGTNSAATLTQTGARSVYTLDCGRTNTWVPTRGWNYAPVSFDLRSAHGDTQHFAYWTTEVKNGTFCADPHGFRLTTWTFPQGSTVTVDYTPVTGDLDVISDVHNNLGRQINFTNGGIAEPGKVGGFTNNLTGADLRTISVSSNPLVNVDHTDPNGKVTTFVTHLIGGTLYRLDQVLAADDVGAPTRTPALAYTYDSMGRVMTASDRLASLGLRPAYQFHIAEQLRGERIDPLGQSYAVTYDYYKRPTRFVDERGKVTLAAYDGVGRAIQYTYPKGDQELFMYDSHNNPIWFRKSFNGSTITINATFDQTWNKLLTLKDGLNFETDFTYGAAGTAGASLLVTALRPQAGNGVRPRYSFAYNGFGQLLSSTDPTSLVVTNTYDANNYLATTAIDPTGFDSITTFTNNAVGDPTSIDGPRMDVVDVSTAQYDNMRRKVLEIQPDPGNGQGAVATRTTYDPVGRVTLVENGAFLSGAFTPLHNTAYGYDADGNKTAEVVGAGGAAISATNYAYDFLNRLHCAAVRMNPANFTAGIDGCSLGSEGLNGPDRITRTAYNEVGQVAEVDIGYGTSAQAAFEAFTYNDNGTKATLTDANGNLTSYLYDSFDRLGQVTYPSTTRASGTSNASDKESYSYDNNNNLHVITNRDGTTVTNTYDALNELTSKVFSADAANSVYSTYDGAGRPFFVKLGSLTGAGIAYTYDSAKRQITETSFGRTVTSAYDLAGNRTQITWPDGKFVIYTYDAANRVSQIQENGATSGHGLLASFTYGPLDERTTLARGNGTAATYSYDPIARLTGLTQGTLAPASSSSIQTLGYNPASQLLTVTQATSAYVWTGQPAAATQETVADGLNRDMRIVSLSNGYSSRGNLTFDGTRTFAYDTQNRLTGVTGGSTPITITYDPAVRLQQTVTGPAGSQLTTQFLYDGPNLIAEYNASTGAVMRRYVHGTGIDEPLVWYEGATLDDNTRRFLHADHQGSIIGWTDSSGNLGESYTYGPYGEPQSWSGSHFRYTGQLVLAEAQLYDYKARVYDPIMGHFLQTDPIGPGDDPNLYAYVKNDPVDHIDPTGTATQQFGFNLDLLAAQFKVGNYREITPNDPVTSAYPIATGRYASKGAGLIGALGATMEYTYCGKCKEGDLAGESRGSGVSLGLFSVSVSDDKQKPSITFGFGLDIGAKLRTADRATLYSETGQNAGQTLRGSVNAPAGAAGKLNQVTVNKDGSVTGRYDAPTGSRVQPTITVRDKNQQ